MILLLGNWISTTFGNEINGRSLISFLWCIKKLNNKTLKYIKEYFSEEIHDQLIKGIEILDNEFEKSKETILYDNYGIENDIDNENKENHQNNENIKGNEDIKNNLSKEMTPKKSLININEENINISKENVEIEKYESINEREVKKTNIDSINNENSVLTKQTIDIKPNTSIPNREIGSINNDNQNSINSENKVILSGKNEKSNKNTLMQNLMEIDEQFSMLPEETFISDVNVKKGSVVEKSFVTHKNIQLSGISDNVDSFSEKEKSFSKSKKMDTDIEMKINPINEINVKTKENSIQDVNTKKSNIKFEQKIIESEDIKNKESIMELKKAINKNSMIELVSNDDVKNKIISETVIENKKETDFNNEEKVNIKKKSIRINDDIKIKDESFIENNPSKKIKIDHDLSKSVILIENSDLIFEKENPRRKLNSKSKESNNVIIIDDDTKSNIHKIEKEKSVIFIDNSYDNNDIKIKNAGIQNINKKKVFNVVDISNDQDQKTPKNDFETNLNNNERDNHENIDNVNDKTINIEISTKENENLNENLDNKLNGKMAERLDDKLDKKLDEKLSDKFAEKTNEKLGEKLDDKPDDKPDEKVNNHEIVMESENNESLGKYICI